MSQVCAPILVSKYTYVERPVGLYKRHEMKVYNDNLVLLICHKEALERVAMRLRHAAVRQAREPLTLWSLLRASEVLTLWSLLAALLREQRALAPLCGGRPRRRTRRQ